MSDCNTPEQVYNEYIRTHTDLFPVMVNSGSKRQAFNQIGSIEYDSEKYQMSFFTAVTRGRISLGSQPQREIKHRFIYETHALPDLDVRKENIVLKELIADFEKGGRKIPFDALIEIPARNWKDLDEFITGHFGGW